MSHLIISIYEKRFSVLISRTFSNKAYLVSTLIHISSCVVIYSQHRYKTIGIAISLKEKLRIKASGGEIGASARKRTKRFNSGQITLSQSTASSAPHLSLCFKNIMPNIK